MDTPAPGKIVRVEGSRIFDGEKVPGVFRGVVREVLREGGCLVLDSGWHMNLDLGDELIWCADYEPRAELGVDGNAGFALLGPNLQEGDAEFVDIDLPTERSQDPLRWNDVEWLNAASLAASKAFRNLKARYPKQELSYFLSESHPRFCP
jgi:hypothetical protein